MSSGDFKEITIRIGKKDVGTLHMEKGCSFENNGRIYRIDDDNNLSVFDKEKRTWSTSEDNTMTMTQYQLDTFKAVANNRTEKGFKEGDIVLSKKDIDKAQKMYTDGELTADLSEGLRKTYKQTEVTRYKYYDAFSTYTTNGKEKESGRLIFKYGSEWGAEKLSKVVNGEPEPPKTEPAKVEPAKAETVKKTKKKEDKKPNKPSEISGAPIEGLPKIYTEQIDRVARQMGISTEEVNEYIRLTAKNTKHSEYFVAHIISNEEFIGTAKDIGDGTITAGFGRTRLRDKSITKGMEVTPEQAFDWLEKDILYFESKVKEITLGSNGKETIGQHWDEIPSSLREGLIDVAFNRDVSKLEDAEEYRSFRANFLLGEGYLPACAVRLRQDFSKYTYKQKLGHKFTTGLMKRNCYRFMLAIQSFTPEQKAAAKRRFNNADNYYTETINLLKAKGYHDDAKKLQQAWDNLK